MIIRSVSHLEALLRRYNVKYKGWITSTFVRVSITVRRPNIVLDVSSRPEYPIETAWAWCVPCPDADFKMLRTFTPLGLPGTW